MVVWNWIPNHLNNELLIVRYSNVSVIRMFAIRIPTVQPLFWNLIRYPTKIWCKTLTTQKFNQIFCLLMHAPIFVISSSVPSLSWTEHRHRPCWLVVLELDENASRIHLFSVLQTKRGFQLQSYLQVNSKLLFTSSSMGLGFLKPMLLPLSGKLAGMWRHK